MLKIFYDSIPGKASELEGFYSSENWKDYTIKIHALKSSARLIGALDLSGKAQLLETAGKEENIAYIRDNHSAFMQDYMQCKEILGDYYSEGKEKSDETNDDRPLADEQYIAGVYERLREAAEDMDCTAIEDIFDELGGYRLADDDKKKLDAFREKADDFDYDSALEALG